MSDVSMERLGEMHGRCDNCTQLHRDCFDEYGHAKCQPNLEEAESMSSELTQLRELIGNPDNFSSGDHATGRVCVWLPIDVYIRCRTLLGGRAMKPVPKEGVDDGRPEAQG
jgi:hypothetical protein